MADEESDLRPFADWLREHRRGEASLEWADEMALVLEAVMLTGKKGKVTITLEFEKKGRTVVVVDSVDSKAPKPDREASVYFSDQGSLVRYDPTQVRMEPFPNAEGGTDLRVVDPGSGEITERGSR